MSDALTPIIHRVAHELIQIEGVIAVVLGGSRGRNAADASSDTDIGIYYDGMNPPSIDALRSLGARLDDRHSRDVVTNFGDWGRGSTVEDGSPSTGTPSIGYIVTITLLSRSLMNVGRASRKFSIRRVTHRGFGRRSIWAKCICANP